MTDFPSPAPLPRRHGGGLAHHTAGAGAPLLLIHGVGLSADCWHEQIAALQPHCRVVAVDLPGHGTSPPFTGKNPTLDDFTDKIAAFIESELGGAVAVAGHSLGALIALALAIRHPKLVNRVAALSAVSSRDPQAADAVRARAQTLQHGDAAARAAQIDATITRWFGAPPAHPAAAAQCRHWLQQTAPASYAAGYRVFADNCAGDLPLQTLRAPTLYLTGDGDAHSTAAMSRDLATRTPAARARVIAGHAHLLQLTAAAAVSAALLDWMDGGRAGKTAA